METTDKLLKKYIKELDQEVLDDVKNHWMLHLVMFSVSVIIVCMTKEPHYIWKYY